MREVMRAQIIVKSVCKLVGGIWSVSTCKDGK